MSWVNRGDDDCRSTDEILAYWDEYHRKHDEQKPYAEYVVWYEIGFTDEPTLVGFNDGPVP